MFLAPAGHYLDIEPLPHNVFKCWKSPCEGAAICRAAGGAAPAFLLGSAVRQLQPPGRPASPTPIIITRQGRPLHVRQLLSMFGQVDQHVSH
jgi:hypothetical protein